ncbi:hypothetical protein M9Y10_025365 [Tritrichomonas musculus]|uniref:Initiator binding domain-containing protein n=1 Tax=Tritrichomonas musculus TaxID=1915356 RepID=A0ABR2HBJ7_9EUKA
MFRRNNRTILINTNNENYLLKNLKEPPDRIKLLKEFCISVKGKGFVYILKQYTIQPNIGYFINSLVEVLKFRLGECKKISANSIKRCSEKYKDKIMTKIIDENQKEITKDLLTKVIDNMKSNDDIKKKLKETKINGKTFIEMFLDNIKEPQNTQNQNVIDLGCDDDDNVTPISEKSINCISEDENSNNRTFENEDFIDLTLVKESFIDWNFGNEDFNDWNFGNEDFNDWNFGNEDFND